MSRNIDEAKLQAWKVENESVSAKTIWHKVIPYPDEKEGWGEAIPYKSEDIVKSEESETSLLSEKEEALLDIRLQLYECIDLLDNLVQVMESDSTDITKKLDSSTKGALDNIEELIITLKETLQIGS